MEAALKTVRSDWNGVVLVCGKCSKKLDGGFGKHGRTSLAKALRKVTGSGKGRKARLGIVETRCVGVCPKRAVVVVAAATPARWLVVPEGTSVEAVAERLAG